MTSHRRAHAATRARRRWRARAAVDVVRTHQSLVRAERRLEFPTGSRRIVSRVGDAGRDARRDDHVIVVSAEACRPWRPAPVLGWPKGALSPASITSSLLARPSHPMRSRVSASCQLAGQGPYRIRPQRFEVRSRPPSANAAQILMMKLRPHTFQTRVGALGVPKGRDAQQRALADGGKGAKTSSRRRRRSATAAKAAATARGRSPPETRRREYSL